MVSVKVLGYLCHLPRRERQGLRGGREGVMLPACCALWVPVRSTDSGNLIIGVVHSILGRHRGAERAVPSRSLRRTRLRGRVTPAHPTRERQPVPRELVARPLPGYRTCALIGRACVYNRQTQKAYAIPARREQRGVGDATGSRPQADDGGTPSLNQVEQPRRTFAFPDECCDSNEIYSFYIHLHKDTKSYNEQITWFE